MSAASEAGREPLTEATVMQLAAIIQGSQQESRVRRELEDGEVFEGVARSLVVHPDRPHSPGKEHDIRNCYLRVSSTFEHFWPIAELLPLVASHRVVFG